jgi:hypothetical protein
LIINKRTKVSIYLEFWSDSSELDGNIIQQLLLFVNKNEFEKERKNDNASLNCRDNIKFDIMRNPLEKIIINLVEKESLIKAL